MCDKSIGLHNTYVHVQLNIRLRLSSICRYIYIGYMASIMTAFTEVPQKFALCTAIVQIFTKELPKITSSMEKSDLPAFRDDSISRTHTHTFTFIFILLLEFSVSFFSRSCELSFDLCYEFTSKQCPNIRTWTEFRLIWKMCVPLSRLSLPIHHHIMFHLHFALVGLVSCAKSQHERPLAPD